MSVSFFREDPLLAASHRHPTNVAFVMGAARRGFDCQTERSNINGRYRTQVNQHMPERHWNLAEGYGDTPLESQVNAYARVLSSDGDPVWACLVLEANVRLLGESLERVRAREAAAERRRQIEEKLSEAIDLLAEVVGMMRV